MRPLILLTILLILTLCSCQSQRQVSSEDSDTSSLDLAILQRAYTSDDILSLLQVSREYDIKGISIEYFAPDTANPHIRAAPKTIRIDSFKGKDNTNASCHEVRNDSLDETVNLATTTESNKQRNIRSVARTFHPPDWLIYVPLLALFIPMVIKAVKRRRHES